MGTSDRIKELRKKCGLTQEELANKLGLKKSAIAKYENGRVENIKRSTLMKMAEIFDCSPAYLLDMQDVSISNNDLVLTKLEKEIIIEYRKADDISKAMVLRALTIEENLSKKEGTA